MIVNETQGIRVKFVRSLLAATALFLSSCSPDSGSGPGHDVRTLYIAIYNPQGYVIDSVAVAFQSQEPTNDNDVVLSLSGDTTYLAIPVAEDLVEDSLHLEVILYSQTLSIGAIEYLYDTTSARFVRNSVLFKPMLARIGTLLAQSETLPENRTEAIALVVAQALVAGDSALRSLGDSTPVEVDPVLVIAKLQQMKDEGEFSAERLDSLLEPLVDKDFWAMQWQGQIDSAQAGSTKIFLSEFFVPHQRIARFEITQGQYAAALGESLPTGVQPGRPIRSKNFYQAALFCNALTNRDATTSDTFYTYSSIDSATGYLNDFQILSDSLGLDSFGNMRLRQGFRLPTYAEWKTAYYWGTSADAPFYWGSDSNAATLSRYANWNSEDIALVGERQPSRHGLFDMSGNVAEWTQTNNGPIKQYTQYHYSGGNYQAASPANLQAKASLLQSGLAASQGIGWRVIKIEE